MALSKPRDEMVRLKYSCVKHGLASFLREGVLTTAIFEKLAQDTSKVTYWAYKLLLYYIIHQFDRGKPLELYKDALAEQALLASEVSQSVSTIL